MGYQIPLPVKEVGVAELVGVNDNVAQNEFTNTADLTVGGGAGNPQSGLIQAVALYSTVDGTGAVIEPLGDLLFLDADPNVSAGDTALAAAEWPTVIGHVAIASGEWVVDAAGGIAYVADLQLPFHALSTIYAVMLMTSATEINSAGGDDEQLELNVWFQAWP